VTGDRNLKVEDGQFQAITEYHKSQAITDTLKVLNPRKELTGRSFPGLSVIESASCWDCTYVM